MLELNYQIAPFAHWAMYQNNIVFFHYLNIHNAFDHDLKDVNITIESSVSFLKVFSTNIALFVQGTTVNIPLDDLKLIPDYLKRLTEVEKCDIIISIKQNDEVIQSAVYPIRLFPIDYWQGLNSFPEMIVSFATPNHPYVCQIKKLAVKLLENSGLVPEFTAYQSQNPNRILEQITAIYNAIRAEQIVYSALPASFEQYGQRLRLLDTISHEKFANCIDISLLFVACLEAIGLNPIIIFVKGHAFVGCWLHEEMFSEIVNDDIAAINKRTSSGINEIVVIEATSLCKGANLNFKDAIHLAEKKLLEQPEFICSIDVKRARLAQINPLPQSIERENIIDTDYKKCQPDKIREKFELNIIDGLPESNSSHLTKQKLWERKLLDLSLRNSLLNLRPTRNSLSFLDIDLSVFEDMLSFSQSFTILPFPKESMLDLVPHAVYLPRHPQNPEVILAQEELKQQKLRALLNEVDLEQTMTQIYRNARQSFEENGANSLYIALGLLKWYETDLSEKPRFAPLLLIPVELSRRSAKSNYKLKYREEEPFINITLIEFLKQSFQLDLGGLEQIPLDDKGIDVPKVFAWLRRAIINQKGWDVIDKAVLGNFSFSKYILWKDIAHNADELRKSKIVDSLLDGQMKWEVQPTGSYSLDAEINPKEVILPIATDASQLWAVLEAQRDKSFVLHGPPGTGKSQTITNIIANALYQNKKVLFVAAKKAALDVVYKRLSEIGLEHFCLELHSNKARKSDVLQQLEKTIQLKKTASSDQFRQQAEAVYKERKLVNNYITALHKKYHFGISLYEAVLCWEEIDKKDYSLISIDKNILSELKANDIRVWENIMEEYALVTQALPTKVIADFQHVSIPEFSNQIKNDLLQAIQLQIVNLSQLKAGYISINKEWGLPVNLQSAAQYRTLKQCILLWDNSPSIPWSLIQIHDTERTVENIKEFLKEWESNFQSQNEILQNYEHTLLTFDISSLKIRWNKAQQTWWLPKYFQKKRLIREISTYHKHGKLTESAFINIVNQVEAVQLKSKELEQVKYQELQKHLDFLWKGSVDNFKEVHQVLELTLVIQKLLTQLLGQRKTEWISLMHSVQVRSTKDLLLMIHAPDFTIAFEQFQQQELLLKKYFASAHKNLAEVDFQTYTEQLKTILANADHLKNIYHYQQVKEKVIAKQLHQFVHYLEGKDVKTSDYLPLFNASFYHSVINYIIDDQPVLSTFSKNKYEFNIKNFIKLSQEFTQLTRQELYCSLSQKLPNPQLELLQSSEVSILQKAIKNNGRGLSLRKLFDQIPNLLPRLAPCMLMSPISVAQYFEINNEQFDLLIFDEASQLPTCEAIGALSRAKNAIIVGDPKQMPPTSFFNVQKVDEDHIELEDLESILDDCLAISMPSNYLLKHYRSQHESLIAFSNAQFYDNKLFTFPSADDLVSKVRYVKVPGYYDKGKSRTNRNEAAAIIQEISYRLRHTKLVQQSIGVVTFSQAQQNLIEDMLDEHFVLYPELEQLALQREEPVFIKNLENVQGDERDVILFSIGYGPDKEGNVSMNFGPVNREGGWRRLNVAVTRARTEMIVFSTLQSEQIDLNRTQSKGVAHFKAFLQFAEKGFLIQNPMQDQSEIPELGLGDVVAKRLAALGWEVKLNIGSSDFKIDIGIVNPKQKSKYLLGIIIDGKGYNNAATLNDREVIIPNMLYKLGWKIYRIWTLDWWENEDQVIKNLDEYLNQIGKEMISSVNEMNELPNFIFNIDTLEDSAEDIISSTDGIKRNYEYKHFNTSHLQGADAMLHKSNSEIIKNQIIQIVQIEAPIQKQMLYKRLLSIYQVGRMGSRIELYLDEMVKEINLPISHARGFDYYWNYSIHPENIDYYRISDHHRRSIDEIALEELAVALFHTVQEHLSAPKEQLFKHLVKLFKLGRLTHQIEQVLEEALNVALNKYPLKVQIDRVIFQS